MSSLSPVQEVAPLGEAPASTIDDHTPAPTNDGQTPAPTKDAQAPAPTNDVQAPPPTNDVQAPPPTNGAQAPAPTIDAPAQVPTPNLLDATNPSLTNGPPSSSEAHSFVDDPRAPSPLRVPNPPFLSQRDSIASSLDSNPTASTTNKVIHPADSLTPLDPSKVEASHVHDGGEPASEDAHAEKPAKRNVRTRWLLLLLGALVVALAIILGVYFGVTRRNKSTSSAAATGDGHSPASPSASGSPGGPGQSNIVYGGDGTVVTTEQGTTFTYSNKFGGYFVQDSGNPFNNGARAQSWSPPLNQSWEWGKDQILGVNLGGWLVLEPFITPALYQKYPDAIDEWTLHAAMAKDTKNGGLDQLEEHYKTFITEEDFAQIAGAGLNWVRLPIAFWAIDTWEGEPFLAKVSWKYALKAFEWARKYGLRIMLDLHATPGSQNGYNHSGRFNQLNFLNGVMGIANAQRLLHYIRIFTEFISQPEYKDVVPMFGIVNEPNGMPSEPLANFYIEAHRMIRNITGVGAGNGPFISIHTGGSDLPNFRGSDRIAREQHPYFAFSGGDSPDIGPFIDRPCEEWGSMINSSQRSFGVTTGSEWSLGFNDCGFMLHTTADEHTTTGCDRWDNWEDYTPAMKKDLMDFAMSSMDALQHWFFWTWKIASGATQGSPRAPLWSYKLGLDNGWIPKNPRDAFGHCASGGGEPFDGTYLPYQTGGAGAAGKINDADLAQYGQWPPASIGGVDNASLLPTYTATGPVPTLPMPSFPAPTPAAAATATTEQPDGWFNSADTASGMVTVAGCPYPDAWDATGARVPTAVCTGGAGARKREPVPLPVVTQAR